MVNFKNTVFIKSAPTIDSAPDLKMPEILFVGRSNVGKSSLINTLCDNRSLAKTSSKPGHTRLLNYFNVDKKFYLVDAPGYGYTRGGRNLENSFDLMMESYFQNENLKGVVFIMDPRHEMSEYDKDFYEFIKQINIPYILVLSKSDKLNQSMKHKALVHYKALLQDAKIHFTSITNNKSIIELREVLIKTAL